MLVSSFIVLPMGLMLMVFKCIGDGLASGVIGLGVLKLTSVSDSTFNKA